MKPKKRAKPMNFEALNKRIMSDQRQIVVNMTVGDVLLLIGLLQLAYRHPELNESVRTATFNLASGLQHGIEFLYPEAHALIMSGWKSSTKIDTGENENHD